MKRSTFLGAAAALAAGIGVAGCTDNDSDDQTPGSNDNWSIPDNDPTATLNVIGVREKSGKPGMDPMIKAFQKAHPKITVKYQQIPFDNLNSVLDSRITSKNGNPDVFWVDQPRVAALATRGYLADITQQFGSLTSALEPGTLAPCKFQDKLWCLPLENSSQVLYYNADLLKKAGVTPPSTDPDKRITWQQLVADAKKVQQKAGAQYGLLFGQPNRYYQLEPIPASAGGGTGVTGQGNLTPKVNNAQWVEAMKLYGQFFSDKISGQSITSEESGPTFIGGKTGYLWHTQNWVAQIDSTAKFNWGGGLNPVWEGGKPYSQTGSWGIGINPYSKNKGAAAIFLKWLTIDGVGGYGKYLDWTVMPANTKALDKYLNSDYFTGSAGGKQSSKVIEYESKNTTLPRPATIGYLEFETLTGDAFSDISNGTDAQKAMDTAQQKITAAWKKYQ